MHDGNVFDPKFDPKKYFNPDDTVYDPTYQDFEKREHPMLRAYKLNQRIRRDMKISRDQRKALKTRRNIICFRMRKQRHVMNEEIIHSYIPQIIKKVSPKFLNQEKGLTKSLRVKTCL